MEEMIIAWIAQNVPHAQLILMALGLLVIVGQVIVGLTPSTADDAAWEKIKSLPVIGKIIAALAAFAPLQKKDPNQIGK